MEKTKYYVSYGSVLSGRYIPNSMEVDINDFGDSQGMIAEKLEAKVAEHTKDDTVVIVNFWKM